MIVFQELRWGDAFSYGPNNVFNFTDNPLVQLVGKNGHGKSTIALILEEVLFNKNSKGTTRAKVINRYTKAKSYWIELDFTKDADVYHIKTVRGSTSTVKFIKNGLDISSHTATNTYKLICETLGYDHKTFAQIIYQSSASSLQFLRATDTDRKKFLITLLSLERYSKAAETLKTATKVVTDKHTVLSTKVNTVKSWIDKYSNKNLELEALQNVPERLDDSGIVVLTHKLSTLNATNQRISQNETYKKIFDSIELDNTVLPSEPDIVALKVKHGELTKLISVETATQRTKSTLRTHCPTCSGPIDTSSARKLLDESAVRLEQAKTALSQLEPALDEANRVIAHIKASNQKQLDWEKYHALIDNSLPSELLDKDAIEAELKLLRNDVSTRDGVIKLTNAANAKISKDNAEKEVIANQLADMRIEYDEVSKQLDVVVTKLGRLQVLNKTFGPTGVIAYKIESMVKDLEELANEYLVELSDGRFGISFQVNSSDKLNVVIEDNGNDVEIDDLSNGEQARVNMATLLAIRKLIQSLSNTRVNLMILDETISGLDTFGKERLIEVLLNEKYLNTILVSHDYTHPLLEKVQVVKENNISRIEK